MTERLLDSRRYDETIEAYIWVMHMLKKPQAGWSDRGNANNNNENGGRSRGGGGSTETEAAAVANGEKLTKSGGKVGLRQRWRWAGRRDYGRCVSGKRGGCRRRISGGQRALSAVRV